MKGDAAPVGPNITEKAETPLSPITLQAPNMHESTDIPVSAKTINKFKSFFTKKKILIGLPIFLIFVLGIFILFAFFKKNGVITKNDGKLIPETWEKFTLDQKYVPTYTLSASHQSKFGVISKDSFIFTTKEAVDESFVETNLIFSKPVTIRKSSDNVYEVILVNSLSPNETINIFMKNDPDYSWVFQAAPKFAITGSTPANKATNVPVNAGIEIVFNNDNYDLQKAYVDINPRVEFKIEKREERLTIIPTSPLQPKTTYNVTIKKGLALFSGNNSLADDFTFSFQTAEVAENVARVNLARNFQEVFPDEHLITKVYAPNWGSDQIVNAQIYKFSSVEQFISSRSNLDTITSSWAVYYGENDMINTRDLAKVSTIDLKVQEKDRLQYLELPQNLDEGMYLVQFWFDNYKKVEQLWVQSSPIAGYVSVGKLQTVVWINSSDGEYLGSATIGVVGTENKYSTNSDGWSTFPTSSIFFDGKIKHYLQVTIPDSKVLVLPIDNLGERPSPGAVVADDYWTYIYTERILYKPTDTMYYWGVVKNRDSGAPPALVDIYLEDKKIQSVVPYSDGSFIGTIQLKDVPIGYTNVSSRIGKTVLSETYFQIAQYSKPEFKIEVQGNKKAIYAGEEVEYKAKTGFFDGTPASNVSLYLYEENGNGSLNKSEAVANKNGEVAFKYQSKFGSPSNYPRYEGVTVSSEQSGEGLSDGSASVLVYGSRLSIETDSEQKDSEANLSAVVNTLDLDRINNRGLDDPISGVASNQKVSITTTKTWWEKKETGIYYDFVEKVSKSSFTYTSHTDTVDKKDLYTDQNGKISYSFNMEVNSSYHVVLSTLDSQGNKDEASSYFYYSEYQGNSSGSDKVNLNLDRDSNDFSIDEEVDITIQKNGNAYQKQGGEKFLFILANRGRQDVFVENNPELKFNFDKNHVPEVYVGSIIFTGRYYQEVSSTCKNGWTCSGDYYYGYYSPDQFLFDPLLIHYKKSDSKLNVAITTDKLKYNPGDTATVFVKVTKNSRSVANATVQLSVVDEALAAIGGVREPTILSSLYKHVSNMIYYNYYSHKPALPDGSQAERGGGGGSRDLFKDTAFFGSATTDADGVAKLNMVLPDNITNWLTYAQVITGDVDAGQAESSIVTTQEFFMTNQFPSVVLTKDNPVVAVNSWGVILNENSKIPATVKFEKDGHEIVQKSLTINAFKEGYVDFPRLDVGSYSVDVKGTYQNHEDGIKLPLEVIDSRFDFVASVNKTIQKGETLTTFGNINPQNGKPIKLILSDEGKGKYYYNLLSYCYRNSHNLEKLISSLKAGSILQNRFKDSICSNVATKLSAFQTNDGGLSQVEWGSSDLETTVWAVYVDPTPFDKGKIINYLENYSKYSSTEDAILVNWGLTLLGEPRINQLNQLSLRASKYKEKVLAALAMDTIGNKQRAKELYMDILSEYTYANKPYLRIQADPELVDYDVYAKDTSYTLLLGILTGIEDYNSNFESYLADYSGNTAEITIDIANISYIDAILAKLPDNDTIVSYKSGIQNVSKNISKSGYLSLDLKQSELNSFSLTVDEGKAEGSLSYYVTPETVSTMQADNRITLKKSVKKVKGDNGNGIKIGDILEIDLTYDFDSKAPLGCYNLTDHIPSSMTFIENPRNFGLSMERKGYLYQVRPNVVKGCAYNSSWWRNYSYNTSTYYVRVTGAGKFFEEPSIIQSSQDPTIFQKTPEEYITVDR